MKREKIAFLLCLAAVLFFWIPEANSHGNRTKGLISPAELDKNISGFQLIDVRAFSQFKKEHIPGAKSIPLVRISLQALQAAGITRDKPVILYAESNAKPQKAKLLLEVMGYSDVRVLAGGITHWQEDGKQVVKGKGNLGDTSDVELATEALEFSPVSFDFGVIDRGKGVVSTEFAVFNKGTEGVIIKEISTSCGCTSAQVENKKIPPQASALVKVSFDPNFHEEPLGRFSRSVFLLTDKGNEMVFKIYVELADQQEPAAKE